MFWKQLFLGRIMNYQDEFLAPFLSEAVEASIFYFFKNWWMKLKCPILLKPLDTIIQENYQPFYPSEPFRITRFKMRHPVVRIRVQNTTIFLSSSWNYPYNRSGIQDSDAWVEATWHPSVKQCHRFSKKTSNWNDNATCHKDAKLPLFKMIFF